MSERVKFEYECDICHKEKSKYSLSRFKKFNYYNFESERFDICDRCLEVIREKSRDAERKRTWID